MPTGETPSPPPSLLVVDDEEPVREVLRLGLKRKGYRVLLAGDGREALEVLDRGEAVHLIVTDIMMPRLTGLELHAELSRRYPAMPVLLITGCADLPPQGWDLAPVLRKPFRLPDLCAKVQELLASTNGRHG